MTSRTTLLDRRQQFANRQRLYNAAAAADLKRLTLPELRQRVRELASAGITEMEIARLLGWSVGQVRGQLEPDPLNLRR